MDAQIDYAVGLPIAIVDESPVANPATPSLGILMSCGTLSVEVEGMQTSMREQPPLVGKF